VAKKTIMINGQLCVGCHSCEIACKQIYELPVGVFRIKIERVGPEYDKNGKLSMKFKIILCTQCDKPKCIEACSTGALKKRDDSIVTVDKSLCNGCKQCVEACPTHAIWFNPNTGSIEKCDLCASKGLEIPFCVKHCMGKAISYISD
jgi:tetrathionate reductase subunit B